jgi:uncharacterized membrane protein
MTKTLIVICFTVVCLVGCGEKIDPKTAQGNNQIDAGNDGGQTGGQNVVYSIDAAEIKPILDEYCVPCHSTALSGAARSGAPSGIDYDTYDAAVANAVSGNSEIQSGGMPPSGNGPTAEEKRLFQLWVDTGLNK